MKKQVRNNIAANWQKLKKITPGYELEKLEQLLADAAGDNKIITSERKSKAKRHGGNKEIAADPETSPEILRQLFYESEDGEVLRYLAANPSTPVEILN